MNYTFTDLKKFDIILYFSEKARVSALFMCREERAKKFSYWCSKYKENLSYFFKGTEF